jgi:protein-tyrosine phosphatase
VVCALTTAELDELGLVGEAAAGQRVGLQFVAIPIADLGVPDPAIVPPALRALTARLQQGQHVVTTAGSGSAARHCLQPRC